MTSVVGEMVVNVVVFTSISTILQIRIEVITLNYLRSRSKPNILSWELYQIVGYLLDPKFGTRILIFP